MGLVRKRCLRERVDKERKAGCGMQSGSEEMTGRPYDYGGEHRKHMERYSGLRNLALAARSEGGSGCKARHCRAGHAGQRAWQGLAMQGWALQGYEHAGQRAGQTGSAEGVGSHHGWCGAFRLCGMRRGGEAAFHTRVARHGCERNCFGGWKRNPVGE